MAKVVSPVCRDFCQRLAAVCRIADPKELRSLRDEMLRKRDELYRTDGRCPEDFESMVAAVVGMSWAILCGASEPVSVPGAERRP